MFFGDLSEARLSVASIKALRCLDQGVALLAGPLTGDNVVVDGFAEIREQGDLVEAVASVSGCDRIIEDLNIEALRPRGRRNAPRRRYCCQENITRTTQLQAPQPQNVCPELKRTRRIAE
jgi:hypothetical protein